MDALKIEKAVLGGCDWGARTVNIVAALWPERCTAMVSVSGYLIANQEVNRNPLPPKNELEWWYQYYFTTESAAGRATRNTRATLPSLSGKSLRHAEARLPDARRGNGPGAAAGRVDGPLTSSRRLPWPK